MVTAENFDAKLEAGQKIECDDTMSEEYREALINLMLQQADSELAGAYGYIPWIAQAPDPHEKVLVAQIVKDEMRHAYCMYKLLDELGVDTQSHIEKQNYDYRIGSGDESIGTDRLAQDNRVNIFYYPIETWMDFIMFNFLMDRGAGHQLEDTLDSSYAPWARMIKSIFKEEMMHVTHGDTWVEKLSNDPATKGELQETLNKWYPRVMNIFGRPRTSKNELYMRLGLKTRYNEDVREAFRKDVEDKINQFGLEVPEWTPDWEQVA